MKNRENILLGDQFYLESNIEFKKILVKSNFLRVDLYQRKTQEKYYIVKTFQSLSQNLQPDVENFLRGLLDHCIMTCPPYLCKVYGQNSDRLPARLSLIMKYLPIHSEINCESPGGGLSGGSTFGYCDRLLTFIQRKKNSEKRVLEKSLINMFKAVLKLGFLLEKNHNVTRMQIPWSEVYVKKNNEIFFDLFDERFLRTIQIDKKMHSSLARSEKAKKANSFHIACYFLKFLQHANLLEQRKNLKELLHPDLSKNIPIQLVKYLSLMLEDDERLRPDVNDILEMMEEENEIVMEDLKELREKFAVIKGKLPKRLFYLLVWIAQRAEDEQKSDFFDYTYLWLYKEGKPTQYNENVEELYDDNEKLIEQLETLKRIYIEARENNIIKIN